MDFEEYSYQPFEKQWLWTITQRGIGRATAFCAALAASAAFADGHYAPGVEGVQAASVPPPGLYYVGYVVNYGIDSFRAPGSRDKLPGNNSGTVSVLANRFVWISQTKLLGADYGAEAIVPLQRTSLTVQAANVADSRSGVADIYLGPLVLGWHGPQWDAVAGAGVWLDNGSTNDSASPGKGYKSLMLTGGGTWHFDAAKTLSLSALLRWERHGRNDAGVRPGSQASLEWGLGKAIGGMPLVAGLVGYSQWQTSSDSGAGAALQKAFKHAVGGELTWPAAPGLVFKGALYREWRAQGGSSAQPQGTLARLTLIKAF
ncbi:SphA family protein [Xylophilus sp.]|uniref:SphA family protein n=1 Tax=Xylophilus sp. TaxID=2653893 RepID=UPI0013B9E17B|nr:transporter [Xylophilus sp.]KAF1049552.1 MAG: hypothetical protein GAK38_00651 [Xylophilus sp.]